MLTIAYRSEYRFSPMAMPAPTAATDAAALALRLVYSLLRAAVRIAARFGLAMDRLLDLAQLAYFEEHRRRAPRDLAQVARQLDLSVRTTGTLHRRFKSDFFAAEREVEPVRRATAVLLKGE